jgi:hypothetical protein
MSKSIVKLQRTDRQLAENETAPPQCLVVLNNIPTDEWITREDLAAKITPLLKTRQDPERIIAYYQSTLETAGFIRVDRASKKINIAARA